MAKTQGSGDQTSPGAGAGLDGATADTTTAKAAPKPGAVKTYRAIDRGYADGRIVEPGEIFATSAPKGSWMEPAKGGSTYGVEEAVDDAQAVKPDDVVLESMSQGALEAMAAERNVTEPGKLSKKDLITAIKAYRRVDAS